MGFRLCYEYAYTQYYWLVPKILLLTWFGAAPLVRHRWHTMYNVNVYV